MFGWWNLAFGLVAAASSVLLTWIVRALARALGWVSTPNSQRHVHDSPVPRLGGIAVLGSVFVAMGMGWRLGLQAGVALVAALLVPATWMILVGLVDDIAGLRPNQKLVGQVVGGMAIFALGSRIPVPAFLGIGPGSSVLLSFVMTVMWAVVVINAVNLVDGLDGLASGASVCAFAALAGMATLAGQSDLATVAVVVLGALAGFLIFNTYPASIFLGDSGSLVLGALTAGVTIRLMSISPVACLACTVVLAHPLGEVVVSTVRRFICNDPIFRPDRRHLHHRLLDRGLSHPHAAGVLVLASLICSLIGVLIFLGGFIALAAFTLGAAGLALGFVELRYKEFSLLWDWIRKLSKERRIMGAQMRLLELQRTIPAARSLTELRIQTTEAFIAIGCKTANLHVRSYDSGRLAGPIASTCVTLAFPLFSKNMRLGRLELGWDTGVGHWPFDPEFLVSEVLPLLARKLEHFLVPYQELASGFVLEVPEEGDILPQIAGRRTPLTVPLDA